MDHPIATGVGGAGSRLALAWATEHAERTGVRLVLVHVCWPGSPLGQAPGDPAPAEIEFIDPPLARALTTARIRLGRRHAAVELRSGEPEDCLADVSQRSGMLVIGDGEGGRTVRRVLRHAHCPVVVVRPRTVAADAPFAGQVVAGVDGSAADHAVLEFAAGYAAKHHLSLTAVHVTGEHGAQSPPAGVARCARRHPGVPVRSTVLTGPVPDALIRATPGAHLLVVGDKRRGVIGRARTGDVPVTVATEAPCPVAVVQPGG
jgi:nucleotide-binding universal stress UspA family protein